MDAATWMRRLLKPYAYYARTIKKKTKNDVTELEVLLGRGSSRDDDLLVAGNLAHINQPDDNGVTPLHTGCAISRTLTR